MSTKEKLIADRLPAQPAGFKVKALSCNFCELRDRLDSEAASYDTVLDWITRHEKCEERKVLDQADIKVPS